MDDYNRIDLSVYDVQVGTFNPITYKHVEMDMFTILTKDVTTVTDWVGIVHIEPIYNGTVYPYTKLVGFNLVCAQYLEGSFLKHFVPKLMLKALFHDIVRNKKFTGSRSKLFFTYFKAFVLTLRHSRTITVRP